MNTAKAQNRQSTFTENRAEGPNSASSQKPLRPLDDFQCYARQYIEQQPEACALICLGVGFILGWKLKPW